MIPSPQKRKKKNLLGQDVWCERMAGVKQIILLKRKSLNVTLFDMQTKSLLT